MILLFFRSKRPEKQLLKVTFKKEIVKTISHAGILIHPIQHKIDKMLP